MEDLNLNLKFKICFHLQKPEKEENVIIKKQKKKKWWQWDQKNNREKSIKAKAVSLGKINKNDKRIGRLNKKKRMQNAKGQYEKLKKVIITNFVDIKSLLHSFKYTQFYLSNIPQ